MGFKKLALAAAVAAAPMSALALEPMQDEALSSVTGQDGISIGLTVNVTTDLFIEDTDGHASYPNAGFIAIQGVNVAGDIDLEIDAGSTAGTDGVGGALVIGVTLPNLTLANLSVGVSGSSANAGDRVVADGLTRVGAAQAGTITEVMSLGTITLSNLAMDIELGPDATNFLTLAGAVGDISVTNFSLNDTANGGSLFADELFVSGMDLTGTTAGIDANGLNINLQTGGTTNVALMGVGMGTAGTTAPIGNVYITGLDLSGTTVSISGH